MVAVAGLVLQVLILPSSDRRLLTDTVSILSFTALLSLPTAALERALELVDQQDVEDDTQDWLHDPLESPCLWTSDKHVGSSCHSNRSAGVLSWKMITHKGIDGSARKPALGQDTGYMVEKTYHIAPYLGAFVAYLMSVTHIWFKMCFNLPKQSLEHGGQLTLSSIWSRNH